MELCSEKSLRLRAFELAVRATQLQPTDSPKASHFNINNELKVYLCNGVSTTSGDYFSLTFENVELNYHSFADIPFDIQEIFLSRVEQYLQAMEAKISPIEVTIEEIALQLGVDAARIRIKE